MKNFSKILIILSLLILISTPIQAESDWTFEFFGGTGLNIPLPLRIEQAGGTDIIIESAEYSTRPLEGAPYYAYRFGKWDNNKAWEIQLVHHKIYLENENPRIDNFSISHGYNLITANRAWKTDDFTYRIGAGVVLTHPEFTIDGVSNDQKLGLGGAGFYLDGITGQVAISKSFEITKKIFATTEAMYTASYAKVNPDDYDYTATVPNSALHFLIGLGYNF